MKKSKIRALSCLLAVMLCMTVFSTTAFADGGDYYDYELPLETAESGQPFSEESEIYPSSFTAFATKIATFSYSPPQLRRK